jgi:hypothetical protein
LRLASVLNAELKSPCQNFISGKTETFTVDTAKLVRINIIVNTTKKTEQYYVSDTVAEIQNGKENGQSRMA